MLEGLVIMVTVVLVLCVCTAVVELVTSLRSVLACLRFYCCCDAYRVSPADHETRASGGSLLVLIPCLREQDSVEGTVEFFQGLLKDVRHQICLVTTAREQMEKNGTLSRVDDFRKQLDSGASVDKLMLSYGKLCSRRQMASIVQRVKNGETNDGQSLLDALAALPMTKEVAESIASKNPGEVCVIDYPSEKGIMVDQLNYAIGWYRRQKLIPDEFDLVAFYNADSRPGIGSFSPERLRVMCSASISQQYSTMLANIAKLNPIMKSFALYQTDYEVKSGYVPALLGRLGAFPHVVGHGLILPSRSDLLKSGLPTEYWCEDIYLTLLLHNEGERVEAHPVLEESEAPLTLSRQIIQHATWFKTAFAPLQMAYDLATRGKLTLRGSIFALTRLARSLSWLLSPLFVICSIVLPIFLGELVVAEAELALFILMCYCNYGTTALIVLRAGSRVPGSELLVALALSPVAKLLSCLGPMYSFFLREKRATPK